MMDTTTFIDSAVAEWAEKNIVFLKVNGEDNSGVRHNHTPFADSLGLKAYPTLILLRADGTEIDRAVGYMDATAFIQTFTDYIHDKNTLGDYLRRLKTDNSAENNYLIAEKYRWRGKSKDAETYLQAAMEQDSANASGFRAKAMFSLADLSRRDKQHATALARFRAYSAEFPTGADIESADIYIAICSASAGDTAGAIGAYEEFIKKHPSSEDTSYAREQIAELRGTLDKK